jgi:hypothetical protein
VIVLGVILEDLRLLVVVEITSEVIEVCFFTPLLAINEPSHMLELIIHGGKSKQPTSFLKGPHRTFVLAGIAATTRVSKAQQMELVLRTHKSQSIETFSIAICFQLHPQLVDLGILLGGCVSRVTALLVWGGRWVIVMVVLGIKLHGGVF